MISEHVARAESSCKRCHRRKKRCDKTLPECNACQHAKVACSFLDDGSQVASYPIAYAVDTLSNIPRLMGNSYVHGLERRVQDLEQQLVSLGSQHSQDDALSNPLDQITDFQLQDGVLPSDTVTSTPSNLPSTGNPILDFDTLPVPSIHLATTEQRQESLAEELRLLSLEAAAERYLGSSSGLSFAQLTQTILQRLSPDQDCFAFEGGPGDNQQQDCSPISNLNTVFKPGSADTSSSVVDHLFLESFLRTSSVEDCDELIELALLEPAHITYILEFYFAHSHTLYPFICKKEFEAVLWRVYADPSDPQAQSSLWQFKIWMVLAIGSTTDCSVSLTEETEPVRFFNKAMTYFEAAMGCGDMAGLEVLMLQVSYSFFNKVGPNTWFLVGVAARMATGMGLHSSEVYDSLAIDVAEQRRRLFFSLYMMDRVVSLALGRPFAIQDDDITVKPFADVDDENIKPDGIVSPVTLEPSTMAVPLHILALREIASDIGNQVHSAKRSQRQSTDARERITQGLHRRLIEWRRSMPFPLPDLQSKVPHLCTSWFDLNYYTHIIMLYRPSPLSPSPDHGKMRILAEASGMAIRQATNLSQQRRFAYNWLNLVAVFNSALSLMYTSTAHVGNVSLTLDQNRSINDLRLAVELLEAFAMKFSSAKKIQGMIQATLTKLEANSTVSAGF